MRTPLLIGVSAFAFVSSFLSAEALDGYGGRWASLPGHALSRGSWVTPHYQTEPDSGHGENLSALDGSAMGSDGLRGTSPRSYVPLPASESQDTSALPASAKPHTVGAELKVEGAKPWCPPERIVGSGAGFCRIN
jgi:hypothetical protein